MTRCLYVETADLRLRFGLRRQHDTSRHPHSSLNGGSILDVNRSRESTPGLSYSGRHRRELERGATSPAPTRTRRTAPRYTPPSTLGLKSYWLAMTFCLAGHSDRVDPSSPRRDDADHAELVVRSLEHHPSESISVVETVAEAERARADLVLSDGRLRRGSSLGEGTPVVYDHQ